MTVWQAIQRHVGVEPDGIPGDETAKAVAKALGLHSALPVKRHLEHPDLFFSAVRKITGPLDQVQVDVINAILAKAAHWTIGWLAYGLATAYHEARLKPIEEWGKGKGRPYGKVNATGKAPYGRGLVQLTWDHNYSKADAELGLEGTLAANYDRALEPVIAVAILVRGMEEGWFTSKSLSSYIAPGLGAHDQFVAARRIINGTDRAEDIAKLAEQFKQALIAGVWG